jgi:DNA-binding NtrC family response regulator
LETEYYGDSRSSHRKGGSFGRKPAPKHTSGAAFAGKAIMRWHEHERAAMAEPIRILLVDDEEMFLQSIARVLKRKGLDVHTAPSGPAALKMLGQGRFDVIVLDVRMPEMDGLTALGEIRRLDPDLPVVVLSGHIQLEQVGKAVCGGAYEVLLKPCPIETLVTAIENACERKAIARECQ